MSNASNATVTHTKDARTKIAYLNLKVGDLFTLADADTADVFERVRGGVALNGKVVTSNHITGNTPVWYLAR